jgi:hypothetical protein
VIPEEESVEARPLRFDAEIDQLAGILSEARHRQAAPHGGHRPTGAERANG